MEALENKAIDCINEFLGNAKERYFGEGFKAFDCNLSADMISLNLLEGSLRCSYHGPDRPRSEPAHLGSIEYLAFALHIATHALHLLTGICIKSINSAYLRNYKITIGNSLSTGDHNFTCYKLPDSNEEESQQGCISSFEIHIENNMIYLEISHEPDYHHYKPLAGETIFQDAINMYNLGFKNTALCLHDIQYNLSQKQIFANVQHKYLFPENSLIGIGSTQERLLATDATRVFGQLMQILLYKLINSDRQRCANIWLRKMTLQQEEPHPSAISKAEVRFDQIREIKHRDKAWQLIKLSGRVGNYEGVFEVAYQVT